MFERRSTDGVWRLAKAGLHKTDICGIQDTRQIVNGKTNDKENNANKRWVHISYHKTTHEKAI